MSQLIKIFFQNTFTLFAISSLISSAHAANTLTEAELREAILVSKAQMIGKVFENPKGLCALAVVQDSMPTEDSIDLKYVLPINKNPAKVCNTNYKACDGEVVRFNSYSQMTAKGFNEVILKNDYYSRELVFKVGPEAPDLISTGDYDDANPIPGTVQTISNINIYVDKGRSTYDHCPPMSP